MLETETARLLLRGAGKAGGAAEVQTASEGSEAALPLLIEFGLTDRLELMLEPVVYATIRPDAGPSASGLGDFEATQTYQCALEQGHRPAMAVAAEIKIPTAQDDLIGTGKTDYAAYFIASKKVGTRTDLHANAAYTVIGSPAGVKLDNVFSAALALVHLTGERTRIFGEILGSTAAAPDAADEGGTSSGVVVLVPEASGSEIVGTAGLGWDVGSRGFVYSALSYDNQSAVQLRVGFTLRWGNTAPAHLDPARSTGNGG